MLYSKCRLNRYDLVVMLILFSLIVMFFYGWQGMHASLSSIHHVLSQSILALAYDLLRTNMRLVIGLLLSFLFALSAGVLAAKNKHAAYFILPCINFMESVPLVGFMAFSVMLAMKFYPHSVMGLEWAAIFGVFTGQAWNMALSVYQSLIVVPDELIEFANSYQLSAWQKFWKIEYRYAVPGLLWNTMVSQSAAWFALVGTEALAVGAKTVYLPGVGSYIQMGLNQKNIWLIVYALIAISLNIIIFDQLLFRPLVKWSEKFKFEKIKSRSAVNSIVYDISIKCDYIKIILNRMRMFCDYITLKLKLKNMTNLFDYSFPMLVRKLCLFLWYVILSFGIVYYGLKIFHEIPHFSVVPMLEMMAATTSRVAVAMLLSIAIFLPLGVWIGSNKRRTRLCQPVIQVLAAMPPDILYPLMAIFLIYFHYDLSWWSIVMIMLGTQWYILFNVIAGVVALPQGILDVAKSFRLKSWYYCRHFIIPAIFPSIVTGIISAAGGAWNADITAEVVSWGSQNLSAFGLGAYIANATTSSNNYQVTFGCLLMCLLVALCVIFVWRPLYRLAETKFKIN